MTSRKAASSALGVVDELDGAGRAVAGPSGPAGPPSSARARRTASGRSGAGRLLDHLLVAALQRAVAVAERHHAAVAVADDLDLDVAGPLDQPLEEHAAGAEPGSGHPRHRSKASTTSSGERTAACRCRRRRRSP